MLLTLWEAFFLLLGSVALLILAAIALAVCDTVIRKAMLDAAQMRALRGMRARQLMEARRQRWTERKAEMVMRETEAALMKDPIHAAIHEASRRCEEALSFGLPERSDDDANL